MTPQVIVTEQSNLDRICVRDELMRAEVTLDGQPAYVSGRMADFATVWERERWWIQIQFSWAAVLRVILNRGGAFRT